MTKTGILRNNFNSHPHAGGDLVSVRMYAERIFISTHTPTQGVTVSVDCFVVALNISTHTPTQGVTE